MSEQRICGEDFAGSVCVHPDGHTMGHATTTTMSDYAAVAGLGDDECDPLDFPCEECDARPDEECWGPDENACEPHPYRVQTAKTALTTTPAPVTAPAGSEDVGLVLSAEDEIRAVLERCVEKGRALGRAEERLRISTAIDEAPGFVRWIDGSRVVDKDVAIRIARTPLPAGTSQPLRATNDDRENA